MSLFSSDLIYFIRSDKASTSNMKIDTLSFLGCILTQHDPAVFYDHIHLIVPVSKFVSLFAYDVFDSFFYRTTIFS